MQKAPILPRLLVHILLLGFPIGVVFGDDPPPLTATAVEEEAASPWRPEIPKTWDEEALATLDVPLADPSRTPRHVPVEYYYSIPAQTIYKSYPVYHPDHEPEGYMEWLAQQEPQVAFDPSQLVTKEDWIAAGEIVFDAALVYNGLNNPQTVRDPKWYEETGVPVAADGTVPFFGYFIEEKGTIYLGEFGCGACHTRVMEDGSVIKGAQGNYPIGRLDALMQQRRWERAEDKKEYLEHIKGATRAPYGAPWMGENDPTARYSALTMEETVAADAAVPPGVQARFGTSAFHPVQVPDLIGLEERRYFDRTGHLVHRSIGDLMRYAALNQGMHFFDEYGDFIPAGGRPEAKDLERYSDEQLYALGLYLYSLEPPENPNPKNELSEAGAKIFQREECWRCHQPPLYTNNKLTPVDGFKPSSDHPKREDILPFSVGTNPGLALYTRRGTGLYKVPSLLGVWYRGPFEHSGSVATLEDWFDKRRLRDDYVPTGFRGLDETRAVPGHRFGLDLTPEEKKALIAFLKTL
jgi:hypothetical protein